MTSSVQNGRTQHARFITLAVLAATVTLTPIASAGPEAAKQPVASRVAFTSTPHPPPLARATNELYVVNADGTEKRLVARLRGYDSRSAWSPDGQIVFATYQAVFLVNPDGSRRRNVTRQWGLRSFPVWSPDGERIAFVRHRCCGQKSDIYVMNGDGSGLRRLTRGDVSHSPIWSPSGRRIAFARTQYSQNHPSGLPEVWVMNADGSGQRRLARGFPSAWSPDGQRIVFTELGTPGLYVTNADGSRQRRLTRDTVNGSVAWSPDGEKILFSRYQRGTRGKFSDVYVVNADGSGQLMLTQRGYGARWSPDGEKISFVSSRDGNDEVYVMNADGRGQINVSQSPRRSDRWPAWSPTRKK